MGLGEPITATIAAIPWLWVVGGALFAKWFTRSRPLNDKDMETAATLRALLNRAENDNPVLDPSATEEQRGIYAAVYANNLAMAVGYDFGGEGTFLVMKDDGTFEKGDDGKPVVAKRTGVVEGESCEVVKVTATTSGLGEVKKDLTYGLNIGTVEKSLVPCRNLTKAEAFLPQEEVMAIARLAKNRVDVSRRQAASLQGRF